MCSFLKCPSILSIISWYAFIIFLIALFYYIKSRNLFRSILVFSVGLNLIFFVEAAGNSLWMRIYNVQWLQYFSLFIWPVANVFFIIKSFWKYEKA